MLAYPLDDFDLEEDPIGLDKLTDDMKRAALTLSVAEIRYLVDFYYQMQEFRKRSASQVRQAGTEPDEPAVWTDWVSKNLRRLEREIKNGLDIYSGGKELGQWVKSITGFGPVLSAGLLAHINIRRTPHAGTLWRYAGLDPTLEWLGAAKALDAVNKVMGKEKTVTEKHMSVLSQRHNRVTENLKAMAVIVAEGKSGKKSKEPLGFTKDHLVKALARRPWNARLKVISWKIGESIVKFQNRPGGEFYGIHYVERKAFEDKMNTDGKLKEQADAGAKRVGRSTEAYKFYKEGLLPPGHIHSRAKRWVVKLFLSHYHHVAHEIEYGKPPERPWIIVHGGHKDFIPPPNWH